MERADELDANRAVIVRFYEELCNKWRLDLIDDTLSERIRFRASLGSIVKGRDEFKRYLIGVASRPPDDQRDWISAEGDARR